MNRAIEVKTKLAKHPLKRKLEELIADCDTRTHKSLSEGKPNWNDFESWRTQCQDLIDLIYGPNSRNLNDFNSIRYSPVDSDANEGLRSITFLIGLLTAKQRLKGFLGTINSFLPDDVQQSITYPTVFLSHSGKCQKLADKLKQFLENLGATVIDVLGEPNKLMSIDQKIDSYMNLCNLGIALITADDELKSGEKRERPNIDHEIGMLMKAPNIAPKIILLKEDRVTKLPSNIAGKGYIGFNRSSFAEIFTDLVKEIKAFGFY